MFFWLKLFGGFQSQMFLNVIVAIGCTFEHFPFAQTTGSIHTLYLLTATLAGKKAITNT